MLERNSILSGSSQAPVDMESDDICWICLDGTKDRDPLISPCKCPRKVHPRCLARWQLQQAGRPEETNCRFCQCNLSDWKASLTPENLKPDVQRVQPIMVVYFEGQIHRIPVKQGPDGLKEFTHRIRELFRLPDDVDISLTFGCKEPLSGQHLKLEGIGAFDAAVHCASVAAAERQQKLKSAGGSADGAAGAPADAAAASSDGAAGAAAPAARGQDSLGALGHAASPHQQQAHPHSHYHTPLERSASAMDGRLASASAPSSAQTSGGGADGAVATGGAGLHAAASAPALSHFATLDSSLLALQSIPRPGSPSVQQESSFAGCSAATLNTPCEEPASAAHSARTSSDGGSSSSGAVGRTVSVLSRQLAGGAAAATSAEPFVRQYLLNGGSAAAAAAATAGAMAASGSRAEQLLQQQQRQPQPAPSQLQLPAAAGVITPVLSPFQMAALESCRCVSRSSASTISSTISSASSASDPPQHHHHHHIMLSCQQRIAPMDSSPAPPLALSGDQPPLVDSISEPVPGRLGPVAPSTPPAVSYHQVQQHQAQAPMGSQLSYADLSYTGVPLTSPTSPFAAPHLPALAADNSGNNTFPRQQQKQQPIGNFEKANCTAAASSSPAAVPPTPREHYTASPAAAYDVEPSGNDSQRLTLQQQHHHHHYHYHYHRHHHHQRTYSQSSGQMHLHRSLPQQPQQFPPHDAQRPEQEPTSVLIPSGEPPSALDSSSAIDSRSNQPAPGTPMLAPATRASEPSGPATSTPGLVLPQPAPASSRSPPSSPTVSSARQHRYHQHRQEAARPQAFYGAAAAILPASNGGVTCENSGSCGADVIRPIRRVSASSAFHARQHEYDMGLPCPADDAAALGSLTGRLKYSLRAFSRKVARSLNFQRGVGLGAVSGACVSAHSMVAPLPSVTENNGGEAVEAQAEAEIGTAGGRADCAAVAAAAAGAATALATATAVTVTGSCRQL